MYGLKADEAGLAIICDFSQEPVGSVLVAILNLLDLMGLARSAHVSLRPPQNAHGRSEPSWYQKTCFSK